ncbi:Paraplegin-like protein, partial [Dinothrombium tinctorium]
MFNLCEAYNKFALNLFRKFDRLLKDDSKDTSNRSSEEDNEKPTPPSLFSLLIRLAMLYFLYWLIFSPGSEQYDFPSVSWNEFYYHMLSKGEVESVVVFPGANIVLVRLHPGAIIKGRPTNRLVFKMSVISADSFEQRLREAERSLGIKPENGIPIIYNRRMHDMAHLLSILILIGFSGIQMTGEEGKTFLLAVTKLRIYQLEQTLNQLLVEMDGMAERDGVIMLASTNRAEVLDKALLRPGRFDRHILIDFPTLSERKEIFEQHMKSLKLEKEPSHYSLRLAQLTPGFSGADIANVCNEAALNAAKNEKKQVTDEDFEYAVERVVGGTEKKSSVMRPEERKIVAYHECGHALVGWLLKYTDALLKVSIVPRTSNVLGFAQYLPSDQKLYSQEELFEKMCMALGGRVAESLIFNKVSSGAKDDLQKVTKMAYAQIRDYGMDSVIGPLSFPNEELQKEYGIGRKPFSKKLANTMDIQARLLVASAYKATENLLQKNKDKLKLLAEELLKRETLNYSDIEKLIGEPPFGKKKIIEMLDMGPLPKERNNVGTPSESSAPDNGEDLEKFNGE